jgi:hypothetical protein
MTVDAKCRFCSSVAVARFSLDRGCAVYPDDREQVLCVDHALKATIPRGGSFVLIEDFTVDGEFGKFFTGDPDFVAERNAKGAGHAD